MGYLLEDSELEGKVGFSGVNFGDNLPVELVNIVLAGSDMQEYNLLLVDEFQKMNGENEDKIQRRKAKIKDGLERLSEVYGVRTGIIECSDFMHDSNFREVLDENREIIMGNGLYDKVLQTVPERFKKIGDIQYPLNEIACVDYFARDGVEVKLGPGTEKAYDNIIREMGFNMGFAYFRDAFALGTKTPESVVHYLPKDKGQNNGQRIFLDEDSNKTLSKLSMGPDEANRYFLRLASAAGVRLGKDYLANEEIDKLYGKKLKRACKDYVRENILSPYKGVKV